MSVNAAYWRRKSVWATLSTKRIGNRVEQHIPNLPAVKAKLRQHAGPRTCFALIDHNVADKMLSDECAQFWRRRWDVATKLANCQLSVEGRRDNARHISLGHIKVETRLGLPKHRLIV
jgi:hypothetical protein